jgi:RNA polymerase sigma factor (sigma-70 family)
VGQGGALAPAGTDVLSHRLPTLQPKLNHQVNSPPNLPAANAAPGEERSAAPGDAAEPQEAELQAVAVDSGDLADDALVEATLQGDEAAFESLVQKHARRVFTIARHFFKSQETVEDIAQETFTKAFVSLQSYRRGASFGHWLARIAVNNCYDELRRRKKRSEYLFTEMSEEDGTWLESTLAPSSLDAHYREQDHSKATEAAMHILEPLSAEDQLVLVLLHSEELSVREIADLTGWSEAKVKIRAFRARQAARRQLKRLSARASRLETRKPAE